MGDWVTKGRTNFHDAIEKPDFTKHVSKVTCKFSNIFDIKILRKGIPGRLRERKKIWRYERENKRKGIDFIIELLFEFDKTFSSALIFVSDNETTIKKG